MGVVEVADERGGFWDFVPHGGGEAIPEVGELSSPESGPGHAAQQQQQQEARAPEADHGVQISPPEASSLVQPWPQDTADTRALARPPEIEAADKQHYAPAGGQLDQPIPCGAEQQIGMQGASHRLQVPLVVHGAEQGAADRIHKQGEFIALLSDDKLGAGIRRGRWQVFAQVGVRHGGPCLGPEGIGAKGLARQLIGAQDVGGGGHLHQLGIEQIVELGFEQINDPCQ